MTLRSRGSFWSDDVWLVALLSSTVDLEMLTLGHSPLIDDDFVRWQFMPDTYLLEFILHRGLTHFEMMHSYWGIPTLLILTLRFHLLFMIDAFDGSLSHWHPGFSLLNILGLTWVPTFHCYTPIHPTLDFVIPAPILSKPYIFWAHIFHRLAWPYPFLLWSEEDADQSRVFW